METTGKRSEEAMETLQYTVSLAAGDNRQIHATARAHEVLMDVSREMGGDDAGPTPPECLCIALGGCIVNICRIMAMERQIDMEGLRLTVSGSIDPSRAMGLATGARAGFTGLTVHVRYPADMPKHHLEEFHRELERRCPLCDTISQPAPLRLVAG